MKKVLTGMMSLLVLTSSIAGIDPVTNPVPENKNLIVRDTLTLETSSGKIEMGRSCSETQAQINIQSTLFLNTEVYREAERKGITNDEVIVSLKRDEDCSVTHFSVEKKGQLESMNALAKQFCIELIENVNWDLMKIEHCKTANCQNIVIPLSVQIY